MSDFRITVITHTRGCRYPQFSSWRGGGGRCSSRLERMDGASPDAGAQPAAAVPQSPGAPVANSACRSHCVEESVTSVLRRCISFAFTAAAANLPFPFAHRRGPRRCSISRHQRTSRDRYVSMMRCRSRVYHQSRMAPCGAASFSSRANSPPPTHASRAGARHAKASGACRRQGRDQCQRWCVIVDVRMVLALGGGGVHAVRPRVWPPLCVRTGHHRLLSTHHVARILLWFAYSCRVHHDHAQPAI